MVDCIEEGIDEKRFNAYFPLDHKYVLGEKLWIPVFTAAGGPLMSTYVVLYCVGIDSVNVENAAVIYKFFDKNGRYHDVCYGDFYTDAIKIFSDKQSCDRFILDKMECQYKADIDAVKEKYDRQKDTMK